MPQVAGLACVDILRWRRKLRFSPRDQPAGDGAVAPPPKKKKEIGRKKNDVIHPEVMGWGLMVTTFLVWNSRSSRFPIHPAIRSTFVFFFRTRRLGFLVTRACVSDPVSMYVFHAHRLSPRRGRRRRPLFEHCRRSVVLREMTDRL